MHDKKNLIHHDVKLENMLLDNKGNLKLCDFGMSLPIKDDGDDSLTDFDRGTRIFLPPEAWSSKVGLSRDEPEREVDGCVGTRLLLLFAVVWATPFPLREGTQHHRTVHIERRVLSVVTSDQCSGSFPTEASSNRRRKI